MAEMFKKGQKVWSDGYGVGVVEEIYPGEAFPVVVKFNSGSALSFTSDGRYYTECDVVLFPYSYVVKVVRGDESTESELVERPKGETP